MLLAPGVMADVVGATLVFVGAAAAAVHGVTVLLRRRGRVPAAPAEETPAEPVPSGR